MRPSRSEQVLERPMSLDDAPAPATAGGKGASFDTQFATLYGAHAESLQRLLTRLADDADVAADLAQDAFIRLYRRGSAPAAPGAWLVSVALNLFRNHVATHRRRERLLGAADEPAVRQDAPPHADASLLSSEDRQRVRRAIDSLPERDRMLLLLRAEDYSYRDCASALNLSAASVGVMLARAKRAFRDAYGGTR